MAYGRRYSRQDEEREWTRREERDRCGDLDEGYDREYDREEDSSDRERGRRLARRDRDHHSGHDADRERDGRRGRSREEDAARRRPSSRLDGDHRSRLDERASDRRSRNPRPEADCSPHRDFGRSAAAPSSLADPRGRAPRDAYDGILESRRSRILSHERAGPTVRESKEEPPLPPTPPRQPPAPVPLDFPLDRRHAEYGAQDRDRQDPRLRAELYPLEEAVHDNEVASKLRQDHDGSERDFASAERFAPSSRPRYGEAPHDSSGVRKPSTRSTPHLHASQESHRGEATPPTDTRRTDRGPGQADSLRRRTGGECKASPPKRPRSYSVLREEEDTVERNASVLLPVLEDSERVFHELMASGDVQAVRTFLQNHPDFNINCVGYQKMSALHVAVKQQNEAMVEFLLEQRGLDISDCALYAVKAGNVRIVEMILDRIRERNPNLEFAGPTHSVDFADDLTPLILASQLGNYEMIDFLIKRGHSIPPVHPPFCKCEACKADLKKYDRLRYSTMKLHLYKAICNPMYIFHTTDDPFQRAFELTQELQDAATVFPQFKVSFEELWQSLRSFTVDLIGCCRNSQEVEIILKKSPKSIAHHIKFPRLQYAIDLKQKEFVSHPYTQAVLGDAWTGELLEWKIRSPLMQSLSVLPRIPMLPIMTIMCMFLPGHSLVRKWKTPVNKMISSVASFLIFLIIIFLESNLDKSNQKRGPPNSGLEGAIIIYVVGYIWLNIRICFRQGVRRFFSTMWHWYDTIMLFLFTMTIVFWIASWVDVTANDDVDLPRKYWNALDPELIAEGFFAAAVIMAFFRLNMFLSLNYHLGPLQVSIGKMTLDIFRFIIIFSIIILAWCAGLCRFYQPYLGMVQKDAASGSVTSQVPSFVNFLMTLKTFFWAIFGLSPIESADVIIENLPGDTPGTTIINKHQFTEAVGYIAFALFQFLSVVVVLNMLVACMANTFTKVIDNVTVEWVFGRSQIYLSFMASSILPPPFNLVPTASGIKDLLMWFRLLAKPSEGRKARCSLSHCCFIESETEAYVNNEFPPLMSELAQRYIRVKAEVHDDESTDLDEIRNEINELKDMLRKANVAVHGNP